MPRNPLAADTLIKTVQEGLGRSADSEAGIGTAERVGDPDGLDVIRKFKFDPAASKWLLAREEALRADERVAGLTKHGRGKDQQVTVEFVPSIRADFRTAFAFEEEPAVEAPSELTQEFGGTEAADS